MTRKEKAEGGEKRPAIKEDVILNSMIDGVGVADTSMRIIQANKALVKMCSFKTAGELIGRSVFEFVARPEKMRAQTEKAMKNLMEGKRIRNVEGLAKAKDGKTFPVLLSVTPLMDQNGKMVGGIAVIRDITERKRAEKERIKAKTAAVAAAKARAHEAEKGRKLIQKKAAGLELARKLLRRQIEDFQRLTGVLMDRVKVVTKRVEEYEKLNQKLKDALKKQEHLLRRSRLRKKRKR